MVNQFGIHDFFFFFFSPRDCERATAVSNLNQTWLGASSDVMKNISLLLEVHFCSFTNVWFQSKMNSVIENDYPIAARTQNVYQKIKDLFPRACK